MNWSSLLVGLGGVLIIFIGISLYRNKGFEKLQSAMKKPASSTDKTNASKKNKEEPKEGSKKTQILWWAGAGLVLLFLLWTGYNKWNEWNAEDEQKIAAEAQYEREHPSFVADTISVHKAKEWSPWVTPDSLTHSPHQTRVGWHMVGQQHRFEMMDADKKIVPYDVREVKPFDRSLALDSLRFRTIDGDSASFVVEARRVKRGS